MAVIGEAFIQVKPETGNFEQETEQGVGSALTGVAKKAALAAGAFVAFGQGANFLKSSITAASDLGEAMSKNVQVFGDWSIDVEQFAAGAADALGQTELQATQAVGTFGNLLRAVGLTEREAADMSRGMVTLAADLASFNNANPEEVLEALRSGLVGEAEPLKKFGVNINAARIEAKALELGLLGVDGAMTDAAKSQATYALIMEDTKLAQGDFARTSGGLANQQRILSARFGDLQAKIGSAFLPIVTKVVSFLAGPGIEAFESIARTIGGVLGPAFSTISQLVSQFVLAFRNAGPGVESAAGGIIGVVETLGLRFGDAVRYVRTFVNALRTGFTEDEGTPIERLALRIREGIGAAFEFVTGVALPALRQAVGSFIDGLQGDGGEGSFFVDLGEAVRQVYDVVAALVPRVQEIIGRVFETLSNNRGLAIGLGVALAALISPIGVLVGGFILLYQRSETFREGVATVVSVLQGAVSVIIDVARIIGEALTPVIAFLGEQIGELVTFFVDNWAQIRQAVENAVTAIAVVIAVVIAPIVIFFRSWGDEILAIIGAVWAQVQNIISTAVDIIKGIITVFISVLTGDWAGAWDGIKQILSASVGFLVDTISNMGTIILNLISGIVGGLADLWRTGWQTLFNIMGGLADSIIGRVSSFVGEVVGYFLSIPGQLLGMVGSMASAAASLGSSLINGFRDALSGAVGFAGDIAQAIKRAINNVVLRPLRDALTFTIDLPGPLGSFTVNGGQFIPLLAKGGISLGPTLAVFGEAGREAVLPLPPGLLEGLTALARDRLVGGIDGSTGAGVSVSVVNHFPNVSDASSADTIGRAVDESLRSSAALRRLQLGVRA